MSTPSSAQQRYDGVDVLRGLSIAAVVLLHCFIRLLGSHHDMRSTLPRWLFRLLFLNGGNGVTVFFAVSGFLITTTALRRFGSLDRVMPRVFYRIRFARIAPLLLAELVLLGVLHFSHVDGFVIKQVSYWRAALSALTFHLNWLEAKHGWLPANWDVMWSLSIEEMFYLFFPLVCAWGLRWKRGGMAFVVTLLLTLIVLAPMGRTIWAADDIAAEKSYLGGMGCIAMGCLTAMLLRWCRERGRVPGDRWLLGMAWAGAALMFFAALPFRIEAIAPLRNWIGKRDIDDSLLTLGACLVIFGLVARNRAGSRVLAPVRWLGRLSYEVYMVHEFFVIGFVNLALHVGRRHGGAGLHHGLLLWSALVLVVAAGAGWLTAKWFSEPMNRRLRGGPMNRRLRGGPHPAELHVHG